VSTIETIVVRAGHRTGGFVAEVERSRLKSLVHGGSASTIETIVVRAGYVARQMTVSLLGGLTVEDIQSLRTDIARSTR